MEKYEKQNMEVIDIQNEVITNSGCVGIYTNLCDSETLNPGGGGSGWGR